MAFDPTMTLMPYTHEGARVCGYTETQSRRVRCSAALQKQDLGCRLQRALSEPSEQRLTPHELTVNSLKLAL